MGRMQKDDERAREIAYTIRTKDMGQEEIVKLLVKLIEDVREESGSRDDLQRKLRARDDRITVLEEALRDICDRCETWPNPGDSEALLRAKAFWTEKERLSDTR